MTQGSLAEKLRVLRAREGLSLTEAAARAGVTRDTLSDLEHGKRQPYMPTLSKIAAGYGVPVEGLLEEPVLAGNLGKAPARQEAGQPEPSGRTFEAFQQALERVLAPARRDALRDAQAFARVDASEGIPQNRIGEPPEAEAAARFVEEFSPDERALAFGEVARGYAWLERENAHLRDLVEQARKLLRERGESDPTFPEPPAEDPGPGMRWIRYGLGYVRGFDSISDEDLERLLNQEENEVAELRRELERRSRASR
jgi:transcriptional regulator with XRE-family HTH domain